MWKIRCVLGLGAVSLVLTLAGCSDDHDHDDGHPACGDTANCVDTVDLADGVEGTSADGVFMATITSQNGLNVDENEWMVRLTDADGDAVEGATVMVQTLSVDCGHPGPCRPTEAMEHMAGMYMIMPVHAHGGPWDTELTVHKDGESDTIVWHFCVDAPGHADELPPVMCPDGTEASATHGDHGDAGDDHTVDGGAMHTGDGGHMM